MELQTGVSGGQPGRASDLSSTTPPGSSGLHKSAVMAQIAVESGSRSANREWYPRYGCNYCKGVHVTTLTVSTGTFFDLESVNKPCQEEVSLVSCSTSEKNRSSIVFLDNQTKGSVNLCLVQQDLESTYFPWASFTVLHGKWPHFTTFSVPRGGFHAPEKGKTH